MEMKAQWSKLCVLIILLIGWLVMSPIAWADTLNPNASQLFEVHCAGCHPQGGNIIRRGKTLKLKALQTNHYDDVETIAQLITNGKGNMTAFGDRLSPPEIQALSDYVLAQATDGWKG